MPSGEISDRICGQKSRSRSLDGERHRGGRPATRRGLARRHTGREIRNYRRNDTSRQEEAGQQARHSADDTFEAVMSMLSTRLDSGPVGA